MPFGFLALLAAFGTLANSLRSNSASVLIRTLLRCSARPKGGFEYLTARPLRGPRPGCSFAALTSRGLLGYLIPLPSLLSRHGTPCHYTKPPHSSHLTSHHGQPQGLPLRPPSSLLLTPHSYDLTPTTSFLIPHSSLLTPHSSLLTPHSSLLTPTTSLLTPHPSILRLSSAFRR